MSNNETVFHIPAQEIAPPKSISVQAQAYLSAVAARIASTAAFASTGDQNPWDSVTQGAAAALEFLRPMAAKFKGSSKTIPMESGARLHVLSPDGRSGRAAEVAYFEIHGGGFVAGGGEMCQMLASLRAMEYGIDVFSIDYRLFPEHPYPAALDDCMAAYREGLRHYSASALVVVGASAGGNLAAALMLRARDEGLPLPSGLALLTPALDLTMSGDSYQTNRFLDANLYGGADYLPRYAGGEDLRHPYVSPLFGDFAKGWPPTILMTGTRDLLLSDTVRMHRALLRAGVTAELHVTEAGPHGGFMGANAPEDNEAIAQCRRFISTSLGLS